MFDRLWAQVRAWQESQTLARELGEMSDRELADIGLTRGDIASVCDGSYEDPAGIRTLSRARRRTGSDGRGRVA